MNNLAEVVELRVARPGFEVNVSELEKHRRNSFSVLLEPSEPAWLAAAVLKYQRARHRLSLADVAKSLRSASRNAYASYEQGAREPTLGKFRELLGAVAPEMTLILGPRPGKRHLYEGRAVAVALPRPRERPGHGATCGRAGSA